MKILATGNDEIISAWTEANFGVRTFNSNMALVVMDQNNIVGSVFFHAHNGPDIEVSYFGPGTVTIGVARKICRLAIDHFGVSRITVRTSRGNKLLTRKLHTKLGFVFEGIRHNGYGNQDALMYGLFGKNLARLAGRTMQ